MGNQHWIGEGKEEIVKRHTFVDMLELNLSMIVDQSFCKFR